MKSFAYALLILISLSMPAMASDVCEFAQRSPETATFTMRLEVSCKAFVNLCHFTNGSHYCASLNKQGQSNDPKLMSDLESTYENTISDLNDNLFYDAKETGDYKLYIKKLDILDNESRNPSLIRNALLLNITLEATNQWLVRYGEVLTNNLKTSDDTALKGSVGGFLGYVGLITLSWATKKVGFNFGGALEAVPYIGMRMRMYFPFVGDTLLPLAGVKVASDKARKNYFHVPISPAQRIHFNDKTDLDYVSADMDAAFAQKDAEIFTELFKNAVQVGTMAGYADSQAAAVIGGYARYAKVVNRGLKVIPEMAETGMLGRLATVGGKVLRFGKVTVVGTIVSWIAVDSVTKIISDAGIAMAQSQFENAKTPQQASSAISKIYFINMGSAHDGRRVIELYKDLKAMASLPVQTKNKALVQVSRNNLISNFKPQNFPKETQADKINAYICHAAPVVAKDFWGKTFAFTSRENIGNDIAPRMSAKVLDYMNGLRKLRRANEGMKFSMTRGVLLSVRESIATAGNGLGEKVANFVHLPKRYTPLQIQAIATQSAAIDRALIEAEQIRNEIKGAPAIFPDNALVRAAWGIIPLPDQGKDRIKQYLGRIIAIEQQVKDPDFRSIYDCQ